MAASLRAELESEPREGGWPLVPFAIAAAFFVVAAGAIWFSIHRAAQIDRASLHDRETAKEVEMTGDILEAGRLPLPDFVKDLTPPRQVLMGKPAARPEPGDPLTRRNRGDEWAAHVSMEAAGRRLDVPGPRVSSGVRAGGGERRNIRLGVDSRERTAVRDHLSVADSHPARLGRVTFPQPPQLPPRFRVIDQASAARLRQLAESRGGVHLLLAIEYGKAGLVEDARRELQAELKSSRHAEAVERLMRSLDANRASP